MDGGWGYRPRGVQGIKGIEQFGTPPTLTMTTAGVCGLVITGMDLAVGKQELRMRSARPGSAANYEENKPVADGLSWIGRHLSSRDRS